MQRMVPWDFGQDGWLRECNRKLWLSYLSRSSPENRSPERSARRSREARWRGGGGEPLDCSTDGAVEGSRAVEQWREGAVEPGSVLSCSSEIRPRRARPRRATGRAHSASSSLAAGRSRPSPPPHRACPRRSRPPEHTAAVEIRLSCGPRRPRSACRAAAGALARRQQRRRRTVG
jgi:hypothetical protein